MPLDEEKYKALKEIIDKIDRAYDELREFRAELKEEHSDHLSFPHRMDGILPPKYEEYKNLNRTGSTAQTADDVDRTLIEKTREKYFGSKRFEESRYRDIKTFINRRVLNDSPYTLDSVTWSKLPGDDLLSHNNYTFHFINESRDKTICISTQETSRLHAITHLQDFLLGIRGETAEDKDLIDNYFAFGI